MDKNKPDYVQEIEKLFGNAVELPPDGVYIGKAVTDSPLVFIKYTRDDRKNISLGTLGEGRAVKYTSLRTEETEYD
jgi:hypothetical protein